MAEAEPPGDMASQLELLAEKNKAAERTIKRMQLKEKGLRKLLEEREAAGAGGGGGAGAAAAPSASPPPPDGGSELQTIAADLR
eukprot:SAG22_NODE_23_length_31399_cov_35.631313_36_plen_83_part_01